MTSGPLGILRTDLAHPVPWGLRETHTPGVHRLTNLGRRPLARVSMMVLEGGVPTLGAMPGPPVTLAPGESLEIRAASAPPGSTVVISWQRDDGIHYVWSTPIAG